MKMKKTLAIIIAILTLPTTAFASIKIYTKFTDVEAGSYYENAINRMQTMGIIEGYPDGNFGPENSVTRGQLVSILDRYNTKIVSALRQENSYLKALVCDQLKREDYTETLQGTWDKMCLTQQEIQGTEI